MTARNKIILDRLLARPAALLLNALAWPLGQVMRRSHDDAPDSVRVIAIAKFLGIGSILRSTPLLSALMLKYPRASYVYVTARKNEQLLKHISGIDSVLYVDESRLWTLFRDTIKLVFALRRLKVDLYFDLEVYSAFAAMIPVLGLARNRYGFYLGSFMFKSGLHTHLVYFNDSKNISSIYVMLSRACGIKDPEYRIAVPVIGESDISEISGLIAVKIPYIVINPNSSDLLLERRWPARYFSKVINSLAQTWRGRIFIVGSPEERDYVESLLALLSEPARAITVNTAGKLSLGGVMALIRGCDLMITNDSGLYHIAAAFRVRTISLWGPVNPAHYADMSLDNGAVFYSGGIYCSPCLHKTDFPPCRGNNSCMKAIHPLKVYEKVCDLLGIEKIPDVSELESVYNKTCCPDQDITIRRPAASARRVSDK